MQHLSQLQQRVEALNKLSSAVRLVEPPQGLADAPAPPPVVVVADAASVLRSHWSKG